MKQQRAEMIGYKLVVPASLIRPVSFCMVAVSTEVALLRSSNQPMFFRSILM
jgi:hypothetical protein